MDLEQISDDELEQSLQALLESQGRCEADVIAHLAQVDARRIALKRAQSLFEYCQKRLGFSDNQAYYRVAAARIATRFPMVLEMLARREIHLVNIAPLAKLLTEENHRVLLSAAGHLSKRALLKYLADRFPRPDAASQIRKLPPQPGSASFGPTGSLEPRSATIYRLQLNTSEALKEKLELARDLMSHSNRSGDLAVVVERALDLLIEGLQARRFGKTKRRSSSQGIDRSKSNDSGGGTPPETPPKPSRRRHIKSEVRREVFARDGFCCSYVAADGSRCTARAFVQRDHIQAFGQGGGNSAGNLRHLCAAHNRLAAELAYGAAHVRAAIDRRRASSKSPRDLHEGAAAPPPHLQQADVAAPGP